MALIYLSDILKRANLEIGKVKLIRHVLSQEHFNVCYHSDPNYIKEYTQIQSPDFSKGYDYWMIFISCGGTFCRFYACYSVHGYKMDTRLWASHDFPVQSMLTEDFAYYDLIETSVFKELENRLVIDWGKSTLSWHQKAVHEKAVIEIRAAPCKEFISYEDVCLSYCELKEIVNDLNGIYENWHTALSSVYAVYLITDTQNGKQYVGSAYGGDGLLGRWRCYADTLHGNNQGLREVISNDSNRYQKFQFSILQIFSKSTPMEEVVRIETLYKNKLLSKTFGMNWN